jgi:glycosyltransferase involved in cell wall biosynthesis
MNVVHVSTGSLPEVFSPLGGAIQRRVAELALEQVRRGHEVEVFSPGLSRRRATSGGVEMHYVRCRAPQPWAQLEFQTRVAANLRRRRSPPDVLHFHSEPEGAVLTSLSPAAKLMSYDNYFFRGGRESRLYRVYQKALRRFDALLPCSDYCRDESLRYWALPAELVHRLYNGVDPEQFRIDPDAREAERRRLGVEGKVVLYLGRICRQKGTDTLLTAHERLTAHRSDVELVLAGPVDQFDADQDSNRTGPWEQRMAAAGARYLGRVPDERLRGLYNAADVFVMPTATLEMFGMAAVEAQACGTPVVASDHGGLPETVPSDGGGIRFPVGDADALAAAILGQLDQLEADASLPVRARENALRFAWSAIVRELDSLYAGARESAAAR